MHLFPNNSHLDDVFFFAVKYEDATDIALFQQLWSLYKRIFFFLVVTIWKKGGSFGYKPVLTVDYNIKFIVIVDCL